MGLVYVINPGLGNQSGLIADDPEVIRLYESKGWVKQDQIPADLDPEAINTGETALPVPDSDSESINTGETALPIVRVTDDQDLISEEVDQEQPQPRKPIKKAAPSGDNKKEGVDH